MLFNIFKQELLQPISTHLLYKHLLNCDNVANTGSLFYILTVKPPSLSLPCVSVGYFDVRQFCSPAPFTSEAMVQVEYPFRVGGEFGYVIRMLPGCLPLEFFQAYPIQKSQTIFIGMARNHWSHSGPENLVFVLHGNLLKI